MMFVIAWYHPDPNIAHTISQYHSKIPSFLHSFVFFASIHRIDFLWKVRGPWIPMISPYIFPLSPMISRFSPYPRTSGRMTPNIEAVFTYPLVMAHPYCFNEKSSPKYENRVWRMDTSSIYKSMCANKVKSKFELKNNISTPKVPK